MSKKTNNNQPTDMDNPALYGGYSETLLEAGKAYPTNIDELNSTAINSDGGCEGGCYATEEGTCGGAECFEAGTYCDGGCEGGCANAKGDRFEAGSDCGSVECLDKDCTEEGTTHGDIPSHTKGQPVIHKEEERFLHDLVKAAVMGVNAIDVVEEYIHNPEFKHFAVAQKDEYQRYADRVRDYMHAHGVEEDFFDSVKSAFTKGMVKVAVMAQDTDTSVAEQLIRGTNMGIDTLTKTLNNPWGISQELCNLGGSFRCFMLQSLEKLRCWL